MKRLRLLRDKIIYMGIEPWDWERKRLSLGMFNFYCWLGLLGLAFLGIAKLAVFLFDK